MTGKLHGNRPLIGIDLHTLEGLHQGSRTHCLELFSRIHPRIPEMDFLFLVDTELWNPTNSLRFTGPNARVIHVPKINSLKRLAFQLPRLVRSYGIDLLHMQYICPQFISARTVVTTHDVLPDDFPEYFGKLFRWRCQVFYRISAWNSAKVFTVSEYSRKRLADLYGIADRKLCVLLNGVDTVRFFPGTSGAKEVEAFGLVPGKYILSVGRLEPRKNHLGLVEAFASLSKPRPKLAIVGQRDFGYQEIFAACERLGLESEVVFLEHVDDELLAALHRNAKLFVYPTFAEGFGMPVLEAMASGVPVVTSKTTALNEIAENVAVLIDPKSPTSIRNGIERVLGGVELSQGMTEKGLEHITKFSWDTSADTLAEAYRRCFLL